MKLIIKKNEAPFIMQYNVLANLLSGDGFVDGDRLREHGDPSTFRKNLNNFQAALKANHDQFLKKLTPTTLEHYRNNVRPNLIETHFTSEENVRAFCKSDDDLNTKAFDARVNLLVREIRSTGCPILVLQENDMYYQLDNSLPEYTCKKKVVSEKDEYISGERECPKKLKYCHTSQSCVAETANCEDKPDLVPRPIHAPKEATISDFKTKSEIDEKNHEKWTIAPAGKVDNPTYALLLKTKSNGIDMSYKNLKSEVQKDLKSNNYVANDGISIYVKKSEYQIMEVYKYHIDVNTKVPKLDDNGKPVLGLNGHAQYKADKIGSTPVLMAKIKGLKPSDEPFFVITSHFSSGSTNKDKVERSFVVEMLRKYLFNVDHSKDKDIQKCFQKIREKDGREVKSVDPHSQEPIYGPSQIYMTTDKVNECEDKFGKWKKRMQNAKYYFSLDANCNLSTEFPQVFDSVQGMPFQML
jgi:hypothetical protein